MSDRRSVPNSPFRRFHHIVVAVHDPNAAALDWARLFNTPLLEADDDGPRLAVGDAWVGFTATSTDRTGVARVAVEVSAIAPFADAARRADAPVVERGGRVTVELTGVQIELREDNGRTERSLGSELERFHHVVVAVANGDAALRRWGEVFPFTPAPEGPDGFLVQHHVPVGDAWFGVTATGTDAEAVGRFVDRRGEGVYALALVVRDKEAVRSSVTAANGRVIGGPTDPQMFVDPATTHGILLELAEEWPGGIRRPAHRVTSKRETPRELQ